MVNPNVRTSAGGVNDALEDRELTTVLALGLLGAGGIILAQEVVDQVLPRLGMSPDPTSPRGLGMAAIVKLLGALVFVAIAHRAGSSTMTAVGGVLAFGMLSSMGADLFDVLQRGGIPFNSGGSRSTPSRVSGSTSTPTPSASSTGGNASVQRVQRVQATGGSTGGYR